jgi:hypothetical protein
MTRTFCVALFIMALGLSPTALADAPVAAANATPPQVEQAIERSVGFLQTESAAWLKQRRCAACHHVSMELWSLSVAQKQGYAVDKTFLASTVEKTLGSVPKMISSGLIDDPNQPPDPRPMGHGVHIGGLFMVVAAESLPSLEDGQKQSIKSLIADTIKKERDDGSWEFFLSRPPINENQGTDAAWIIMALQGDPDPDGVKSHHVALEKAIAWLSSYDAPSVHEVQVLKLLVSLRAGKPREQLQGTINEILALQQPDGGWNQLTGTPSDAYATGQTLYVLALAGYTADRPAIKHGIDFLVSTQHPDGSWPMKSRATPDGRPGSATVLTPIICGAGSWATMGLAEAMPKK